MFNIVLEDDVLKRSFDMNIYLLYLSISCQQVEGTVLNFLSYRKVEGTTQNFLSC